MGFFLTLTLSDIIRKRLNFKKEIARQKRRVFLLFMPAFRQMDEMLKKLSAKSNGGETLKRLSDARTTVYGGGRDSHELIYLRGQNTDAAGVNTHLPDAWDTFAGAQGATDSTRPTQKKRIFFATQSYP